MVELLGFFLRYCARRFVSRLSGIGREGGCIREFLFRSDNIASACESALRGYQQRDKNIRSTKMARDRSKVIEGPSFPRGSTPT